MEIITMAITRIMVDIVAMTTQHTTMAIMVMDRDMVIITVSFSDQESILNSLLDKIQ